MRNPPLCQLWQLNQAGAGTYSLGELADMHEALDMEEECRRRWDAFDKAKRKD
jgi:hypothetical protein